MPISRALKNVIKLNDFVSVFDFMTAAEIADVKARTGLVNVAASVQTAINFCTLVGARLYFPPGIYLIGATTLVFKNKVHYLGAGKDLANVLSTVFKYTGASDAIQINNPVNSSTAANIKMEDFAVQCTVRTAGKAAIADVGSSFLTVRRVQVGGNDFGIILDQSELALIDECDIELTDAASTAGIWLVDGAEHSGAAVSGFTNRIAVKHCQISGNTAGIGVADDGGLNHSFEDNNFNGCATNLRVTNVRELSIRHNEMELPATTCVSFQTTKLGGGAATSSGPVSMRGNTMTTSGVKNAVTLANSSISELENIGNYFTDDNAGAAPFSNLAAGCSKLTGFNNKHSGAGSSSVGNTYNDSGTYVPTWASGGVQPAIVDGTLTGAWVRNGNQVTVTVNMVAGPSTTFGTVAPYTWTLPFSNAGSLKAVGTVQILDSGTLFYAGTCILSPAGNTISIIRDGAGAGAGPASPMVWANGDEMHATITYEIAKTA